MGFDQTILYLVGEMCHEILITHITEQQKLYPGEIFHLLWSTSITLALFTVQPRIAKTLIR